MGYYEDYLARSGKTTAPNNKPTGTKTTKQLSPYESYLIRAAKAGVIIDKNPPPAVSQTTVNPTPTIPTLPDMPISGNMGVGSNQPFAPAAATATPEQQKKLDVVYNSIKSVTSKLDDSIKNMGTIFTPSPVYSGEDEEDIKKLKESYDKSAAAKINRKYQIAAANVTAGLTNRLINVKGPGEITAKEKKKQIDQIDEEIKKIEATVNIDPEEKTLIITDLNKEKERISKLKELTDGERALATASYIAGAYTSYSKISKGIDKLFGPSASMGSVLTSNPVTAKFYGDVIKTATTFSIYKQLDPQEKERAKQLAYSTVDAFFITGLHLISNPVIRTVGAFPIGYGMAIRDGATQKEAVLNGLLFSALVGTGALIEQRGKGTQYNEYTGEEFKKEMVRALEKNKLLGTEKGDWWLAETDKYIADLNGRTILVKNVDVRQSILSDLLNRKDIKLTSGEKVTVFKQILFQKVGKGTGVVPYTGEKTTTPDEIRKYLVDTNKIDTLEGRALMKLANEITQSGSNAPITEEQIKKTLVDDLLENKTNTAEKPQEKSKVELPVEKPVETKPKEVVKPVEKVVEKEPVTSPKPPETTIEKPIVSSNVPSSISEIKKSQPSIVSGSEVSFIKISNGKSVGLNPEVYTVKEIYKPGVVANTEKILLVDNDGKEIWTTRESIGLREKAVNPIKTAPLDKAREALLQKSLNVKKNFSGEVMTLKEKIDRDVDKFETKVVPKYEYNRAKFNRMNGEQQEKYEKQLEEKKTVYVGYLKGKDGVYMEIPKIVYDYYQNKPKITQTEIVKETVKEKPKSIRQVANETGIREANIRRILGMGTKKGVFERVEQGVYILNNGKEDIAFIHTGDAVETLPKLADKGTKVDMVLLDIPYKTAAVQGGNRGVKYELLSVSDFKKVMDSVSELVKSDDSPVYYFYSKAESGLKQMLQYNQTVIDAGFKPVAEGEYQKLFKTGKPVTNVLGKIAKPEGIILFNKSGEFIEKDKARNLSFRLIRPKGYQTEKPIDLINSLILQGTKAEGTVLDPFAGSGVTGAEAIKTGRKAILIEKNKEVVEEVIKPRVKEALKSPPLKTGEVSTPQNDSGISPEQQASRQIKIDKLTELNKKYVTGKKLNEGLTIQKIATDDVRVDKTKDGIEVIDQVIDYKTNEFVGKSGTKQTITIPIVTTKIIDDTSISTPEVKTGEKISVILSPSKATSEKQLLKEASRAGVPEFFDFYKGKFLKSKIGISELKIFLKNKAFRDNPVFTVFVDEAGNKLLKFDSPKLEMTIYPYAFGFNPSKLTNGERILLDVEQILKSKSSQQARLFKSGRVYASLDKYADLKNVSKTFRDSTPTDLRTIEMPEMVRLATELIGGVPEVKKLRSRQGGVTRGLFKPDGKGKIFLNPEIFTEVGQAAKTLAHEMGHLADYLPDYTLARGNLIGRIASLHKYMRSTFSGDLEEEAVTELIRQRNDLRDQRRELKDSNGNVTDIAADNRILTALKSVNKEIEFVRSKVEISNPKIKAQLQRASRYWRPFTKTVVKIDENGKRTLTTVKLKKSEIAGNVSPAHLKYRYSPEELYADAISMLYNDPEMLKKKAPTFYKKFFKYLDKKPELKKAYFDLQKLLQAGDDEVMKMRLDELDKNYTEGDKKSNALIAEQRANKINIVKYIDTLVNNQNAPLINKATKLIKQGVPIPPEINPLYTTGGINYADGFVRNFIADTFNRSRNVANKVPGGWKTVGKILQLERSIYERGELANPGGYDPKSAQETIDGLKKTFSEKDWTRIQKALKIFRKSQQKLLDFLEKSEYYDTELIKELRANTHYAAFQVIDYLNTNISSVIYKQRGTLKPVANSATSTTAKAASTLKAALYNIAKRKNIEFLLNFDPKNITPAKMIFTGKRRLPLPPKDRSKVLTNVVIKGKLEGFYIDRELDHIFNRTSEQTLDMAAKVIQTLTNSKFYRKIFVTLRPGFQIFNFYKDFARAWRNMPDKTIGEALKSLVELPAQYAKTFPEIYKAVVRGDVGALIKEMEELQIMDLTQKDFYGNPEPDSEYIDTILRSVGVIEPLPRTGLGNVVGIKQVLNVFDKIELVGNIIERLPKTAGYKIIKKRGGMSPEELSHYVRNYIGSPDFLTVGTATKVTNSIWLFSNPAKEGIKGDYYMGTQSKHKGVWWFKMILQQLPKMVMIAGALSLLGSKYKKLLDGVPEYDKTNYDIIPIGMTETGKTIYVRLPKDETARFVGALMWKIAMTMDKDDKKNLTQNLADVFSIYAGQAPNLNPAFDASGVITTYLSGRNPYDSFRGKNIIPEKEFNAGFKYSFPFILDWLRKNQGMNIIIPNYIPEGELTNLEKILNLPILSDILGRYIKVSDYGQSEINKEINEAIVAEKARKSITKDRAIEKAIKDGTPLDMEAALGHKIETAEDVAQIKLFQKQFELEKQKGKNVFIDGLIYAESNDAKAEMLFRYQKEMTSKEFSEILTNTITNKIISEDVLIKFAKKQQENQKEEKNKTSFNLVKPAYAADKIAFSGTPRQEEIYNKMSNEWTTGEASYYNPTNPNETRPGTDGTGAYGRKVESGSVAFGNRVFHDRLKRGEKIYIQVKGFENVKTPYGMGVFRVDDTMNKRYNQKGKFNIDFNPKDITPEQRKKGRYPIEFKIVEPYKENKPVRSPNNKRYFA